MAVALVQQTGAGTAGAATLTASFTNTPAQGNLLVCVVSSDTTMTSGPSGWTQRHSYVSNQGFYVYTKVAGASESKDVTIDPNGSYPTAMICAEFSGVGNYVTKGSNAATQGSTGQTSRTTTSHTATGTALYIACYALTQWNSDGPTSWSVNSSFSKLTERLSGTGAGANAGTTMAWLETSGAKAPTLSWTNGASNTASIIIEVEAVSGTAHDKSLSETLAPTDSDLSYTRGQLKEFTDTSEVSDAPAGWVRDGSTSDTLVASDTDLSYSLSLIEDPTKELSDSILFAAETAVKGRGAETTDTLAVSSTVTYSVVVGGSGSQSLSDVIAVSDGTGVPARTGTTVDVLGIVESLSFTVTTGQPAIVDVLAISDANVLFADYQALSETYSLVDSGVTYVKSSQVRSVTDTLAVSDANVMFALGEFISDTVTLSDAVEVESFRTGTTVTATVLDSITVSDDSLVVGGTIRVSVSDTQTITDSISTDVLEQLYVFRVPPVARARSRRKTKFWWAEQYEGQTLLKEAGQWVLVENPDQDRVLNAERAFVGGRDHLVNTAAANELVEAGYGQYITST